MIPGMKNFSRLLLTLFLFTLALRIVIIPWYDNNYGGVEPNVIYGIQRILQGQPLYQHPLSGSCAVMQYTPVHYYLVAGLAKLISPTDYNHGLDVYGLYMLSRILALLFNLLTVFLCAAIIRIAGYNWQQSFVFSFPVLICVTAHYYTRGDSTHLLFFTAALYAYLRSQKSGQVLYVLISAALSALCIMTKQSGVLSAGIIGFCLIFIERRFVHAFLYLAVTAGLSLSLAFLLVQGDWTALYQNTVLGLKNGIDLRFLYQAFISQYFLDMVPCYVVGGMMLYFSFKSRTQPVLMVLGVAATLSWLFAFITGIKIGSSNNYFTEFLVCIITGIPFLLKSDHAGKVVLRWGRWRVRVQKLVVIALLIVSISKTAGLATEVFKGSNFKNDNAEYAREQELYRYFRDELKLQKGEYIFFTERRFLDNIFMENALFPTKDVVTQVYLADPKTFDYSSFSQQMNGGLVKYIVTDQARDDINACNDSMPFIWFEKGHFPLQATVSGYCIYRFNAGAAGR